MSEMPQDLRSALGQLVRDLRELAYRAEASVDDGEMDEVQESRAEGRADGYRRSADALSTIMSAWPVSLEGGDDDPSQETSLPEEAVSEPECGASGSAPDAGAPDGVHGVPLRAAPETNVASEQEAARPEGLIEDERLRDGAFFPNPRLSRLGLDAFARCWQVANWAEFMTTFGITPETRSQHTMVVSVLASWLPELEARNSEIARLRRELEAARNRFYVAYESMKLPGGGTPYAAGVAAARAIMWDAASSLGWDFISPPVHHSFSHKVDGWCERCNADVGDENHYHCWNCGRRTGMMGHGNGCPS